ncbi:nascent polypeptide-associated complex subunit alpha, muscle-specific form-like [Elephas maximus indicus]|uniref:nascent polypeptide-associated complex subunit alpha, muscle-specific form-like n=1 Tax=Elephas maximus indicus TaxID=99487 RepID=UPI002116D6BB|nr:nascent polypeptide-associated complex subunit alpha, muscle-specific form-like [Elephas maximus indicus]
MGVHVSVGVKAMVLLKVGPSSSSSSSIHSNGELTRNANSRAPPRCAEGGGVESSSLGGDEPARGDPEDLREEDLPPASHRQERCLTEFLGLCEGPVVLRQDVAQDPKEVGRKVSNEGKEGLCWAPPRALPAHKARRKLRGGREGTVTIGKFRPLLADGPQVHQGSPHPVLSTPPSPAQRFPFPAPSLSTCLATPRRLKVNFHAPPACPGVRTGVPARQGGAGDPKAVTRCPNPHTHTDTQTLTASPGAGSRAGSAVMEAGSLPHPAESARGAGRVQILEQPARAPVPPPSQLPAREPEHRAGPGRKPRGRRPPRRPRPTPGVPCAAGCSPRPPRRPGLPTVPGAEKRRRTPETPGSRAAPAGKGEGPAQGAGPRRRDVTRAGPVRGPAPCRLRRCRVLPARPLTPQLRVAAWGAPKDSLARADL